MYRADGEMKGLITGMSCRAAPTKVYLPAPLSCSMNSRKTFVAGYLPHLNPIMKSSGPFQSPDKKPGGIGGREGRTQTD
jgi:hypothetical protein